MTLRYLSVCSGIEAATQAWHPLGWRPAAVSEIDPFPCHVLAQRFGASRPLYMPDPADTPTHTATGFPRPKAKIEQERKHRAAAIKAVSSLPLSGDIPNLGDMSRFKEWPDAKFDALFGGTPCQSFSVAGLRDGLDDPRGNLMLTFGNIAARYRTRWLLWENVPGVLSSANGRDFAQLLGLLTGRTVPVPADGWGNSGIIPGIADAYGVAWRVLDAQYVRTRRHPRAVPQRRRRVFVVGYLGDWRRAAAVLFDRESLRRDTPPRREAGKGFARGFETGSAGGSLTDLAPTLDAGCKDGPVRGNQGVGVLEPIASNAGEVGFCLAVNSQQSLDAEQETLIPMREAVSGPLTAGMHKSAARMPQEQGTLIPEPLGFSAVDSGGDAQYGLAPTLRAMGHASSHPNAGGQAAVAFDLRGREGGAQLEGPHDTAAIRSAEGGSSRSYVAAAWAVRRLTPRECERLQGFPDDFTRIPWRGKPAALCPDGPRYKALGNSWAVNVAEWVGDRITEVDGWIHG